MAIFYADAGAYRDILDEATEEVIGYIQLKAPRFSVEAESFEEAMTIPFYDWDFEGDGGGNYYFFDDNSSQLDIMFGPIIIEEFTILE